MIEIIEFAKWLQHLDNGTTHYNPHTKEETASIGFSPYDCFVDGVMPIEVLYEKYLEVKLNQGNLPSYV